MARRPDLAASGLAVRVRASLPTARTREVRMFGGLAFMLDDRMLVCLDRDENLLTRVSPEKDEQLMTEPGAGRMTMGGRELGTGWILVSAETLDDDRLAFWLGTALEYHAASAL